MTYHLTSATLNRAKKALMARRRELVGRETLEQTEITSIRDMGRDPRDVSGQAQELDVLTSLKDATLEELAAVDGALHRIDDGSYGICGVCGKRIDVRRITALPEATTCVTCAANGRE